MFDHQLCQVCGSSHLIGELERVLHFLAQVRLTVGLHVGSNVLVARGNRSVVLCGASGDVPEIDL